MFMYASSLLSNANKKHIQFLQMDIDFNMSVKDLVKTLRSAFQYFMWKISSDFSSYDGPISFFAAGGNFEDTINNQNI